MREVKKAGRVTSAGRTSPDDDDRKEVLQVSRFTWNILVLMNIGAWITQTAIACFVFGWHRMLGLGENQWALRQLVITEERNQWLIEEAKKLGME